MVISFESVMCGCVCGNGVSYNLRLMLSLFYSCLAFLFPFFPCRAFTPSHVSSLECFFSLSYADSSLLEFIELLLVLCSRLLSGLCFDSAGICRDSCPIWWCPELMAGSGSMVLSVAH